MENQVVETMVSVNKGYVDGLLRTIQDLKEHVRALESVNRELTDGLNEKE